jgi:hypothetical protein
VPHTTISVPRLREQVNGRVITPDDPGYDQTRQVFYGGFDRHPQVIVQAADADDVATVVGWRARAGWSWRSAAAGTARPGTAPPTGGSCWTLGPCARWRSTPRRAPPGPSPA